MTQHFFKLLIRSMQNSFAYLKQTNCMTDWDNHSSQLSSVHTKTNFMVSFNSLIEQQLISQCLTFSCILIKHNKSNIFCKQIEQSHGGWKSITGSWGFWIVFQSTADCDWSFIDLLTFEIVIKVNHHRDEAGNYFIVS